VCGCPSSTVTSGAARAAEVDESVVDAAVIDEPPVRREDRRFRRHADLALAHQAVFWVAQRRESRKEFAAVF